MKKSVLLLTFAILSNLLWAQASFSREYSGDFAPPQYKALKSSPEPRQATAIKKEFPFDIPLKDTLGRAFISTDLLQTQGKPLVVLFWLTTCAPCRMELAALKLNFDSWKKETNFRLLAISTDWPDNADKFVERTKQEAWQFEAYHDYNREFMEVLPGSLNGLPQVFVFDKNGQIAYQHRRFIPGDELELYAKIKEVAAKR